MLKLLRNGWYGKGGSLKQTVEKMNVFTGLSQRNDLEQVVLQKEKCIKRQNYSPCESIDCTMRKWLFYAKFTSKGILQKRWASKRKASLRRAKHPSPSSPTSWIIGAGQSYVINSSIRHQCLLRRTIPSTIIMGPKKERSRRGPCQEFILRIHTTQLLHLLLEVRL